MFLLKITLMFLLENLNFISCTGYQGKEELQFYQNSLKM